MTLQHGTTRVGIYHRTTILDENRTPVMFIGPEFIDAQAARNYADRWNALELSAPMTDAILGLLSTCGERP